MREREREKLAIERVRLEIEREERQKKKKKKRSTSLYLKRGKKKDFAVTKHIRFVPPFNENEVDKYFLLFEKSSKRSRLAFEQIYHFITKCFKSKASEVHLALNPERTSDYQTVKETNLKAYELIPEAYTQKF